MLSRLLFAAGQEGCTPSVPDNRSLDSICLAAAPAEALTSFCTAPQNIEATHYESAPGTLGVAAQEFLENSSPASTSETPRDDSRWPGGVIVSVHDDAPWHDCITQGIASATVVTCWYCISRGIASAAADPPWFCISQGIASTAVPRRQCRTLHSDTIENPR